MVSALPRRAQRVAAVLLAAVCVTVPSGVMAAESAKCVSSEEGAAFRLRHLQSRLMVAALGCNQQAAYNTFVERFRTSLVDAGGLITHYYRRTGGGQGALNRHVTELANAAGLSRAEDPAGYCTHAWNLFWHLEQDPLKLSAFADANVLSAMAPPNHCATASPMQAADASAKSTTAALETTRTAADTPND